MNQLLILVAQVLAAAAQATPTGLEKAPVQMLPSGKWQVEYARSSCIITRAFGTKPNVTLFGLKPAPYSDTIAIFIIQQSPKGRGVRGDADVRLSSGFVPATADYTSVTASGVRVTTIGLPRETLDALARGDSIAIKAGDLVNVTLKPTAFDKAAKALESCESDLLESWGYSREAQAAVAKRPKGSLRGLFRADDYPISAIENGESGTVGFRLRIEPDRRISECFVVESSGSKTLDRESCAIAKKRAEFSPAVGRDGKPVWSFTFGWVTWMVE